MVVMCSYCRLGNNKDYGHCEGCGAPLPVSTHLWDPICSTGTSWAAVTARGYSPWEGEQEWQRNVGVNNQRSQRSE